MATTTYVAKTQNNLGLIDYDLEENSVWETLYKRQIPIVQNRACDEFFHGLEKLSLGHDHIPQCPEVSQRLKKISGWEIVPVKALISFKEFFDLLANKTFPAASFIRRREDLDYLMEPDIFHEIFGHCPLLTNVEYAAFSEEVGKFGKGLNKEDRQMLARLYWFTVEFGLVRSPQGLKIYGAGILSSKSESIYALESHMPKRKPFDLLEVLRTPYRYDQIQNTYFIIEKIEDLYALIDGKLIKSFNEAKELGMLPDSTLVQIEDVRSC